MYGMYDRTAFSEKVQDSLSRLPEEKKKKKKKKKNMIVKVLVFT